MLKNVKVGENNILLYMGTTTPGSIAALTKHIAQKGSWNPTTSYRAYTQQKITSIHEFQ